MRDEQLYYHLRCQNVCTSLFYDLLYHTVVSHTPLFFFFLTNYYLIHQFISHFETTVWHLEVICGHIYDLEPFQTTVFQAKLWSISLIDLVFIITGDLQNFYLQLEDYSCC